MPDSDLNGTSADDELAKRKKFHETIKNGTTCDLESSASIICGVNIKQLLTPAAFEALPKNYQHELLTLLPEADRILPDHHQDDGLLHMTVNALSNEFFAKSCVEYKDRLKDGEFSSNPKPDCDQVIWECEDYILDAPLKDYGVPKAGEPYICSHEKTLSAPKKKEQLEEPKPKKEENGKEIPHQNGIAAQQMKSLTNIKPEQFPAPGFSISPDQSPSKPSENDEESKNIHKPKAAKLSPKTSKSSPKVLMRKDLVKGTPVELEAPQLIATQVGHVIDLKPKQAPPSIKGRPKQTPIIVTLDSVSEQIKNERKSTMLKNHSIPTYTKRVIPSQPIIIHKPSVSLTRPEGVAPTTLPSDNSLLVQLIKRPAPSTCIIPSAKRQVTSINNIIYTPTTSRTVHTLNSSGLNTVVVPVMQNKHFYTTNTRAIPMVVNVKRPQLTPVRPKMSQSAAAPKPAPLIVNRPNGQTPMVIQAEELQKVISIAKSQVASSRTPQYITVNGASMGSHGNQTIRLIVKPRDNTKTKILNFTSQPTNLLANNSNTTAACTSASTSNMLSSNYTNGPDMVSILNSQQSDNETQ